MKNYYDTLGVSETASDNEIKSAFRKLAAQHHPDKGGSETKFKEINEAYDTLKNTEKRQEYDA
jgi:DnaJ-class molecular chaperone